MMGVYGMVDIRNQGLGVDTERSSAGNFLKRERCMTNLAASRKRLFVTLFCKLLENT